MRAGLRAILEDAKRRGWGVAILDPKLDMTSANGELVLSLLISVAQRERRIIGEPTKAALRVVRDRPR
ncbi:recombinase family protein [Microbacterium sp.]|uniref:recombinase family protein n=1 Tax=Microbacterium sp. TaxID=51671 RepID=UPI00345C436A